MADVEVNIPITDVIFRTWLRSSYISTGITTPDGTPLVDMIELGPDQLDAFNDMAEESTREVAKIFQSRQGDVNGIPFSFDGLNAIYRFNEATPLLTQAASIKETLSQDTKNAIYCHILFLWFAMKGHNDISVYMKAKYDSLLRSIEASLHRLHD